ncbi:MAG: hypothetical protein HOK89_12485 [Rhodospirillaceae bacterium]|nr:hypothetical protein [Rhodospirillaceae bacterium]
MTSSHTFSLIELLTIVFLLTIVITFIFSAIPQSNKNIKISGVSIGIVFSWFGTFILGTPDLVPRFNSNEIITLSISFLFLGLFLDLNPKFNKLFIWIVLIFAGMITIIWMLNEVKFYSIFFLIGWITLQIELQRESIQNNKTISTAELILVFSAIGLGLIAWTNNLLVDRDLAFGLSSICSAFYVCSKIRPNILTGFSIILIGGGAVFMIIIRLIEQYPSLTPSIILLGFVLFIDRNIIYLSKNYRICNTMPYLINFTILATIPIALSVLTAIIASKLTIG